MYISYLQIIFLVSYLQEFPCELFHIHWFVPCSCFELITCTAPVYLVSGIPKLTLLINVFAYSQYLKPRFTKALFWYGWRLFPLYTCINNSFRRFFSLVRTKKHFIPPLQSNGSVSTRQSSYLKLWQQRLFIAKFLSLALAFGASQVHACWRRCTRRLWCLSLSWYSYN